MGSGGDGGEIGKCTGMGGRGIAEGAGAENPAVSSEEGGVTSGGRVDEGSVLLSEKSCLL